MNQQPQPKKREEPKRRCLNCREEYEHTHPWARPLKLCKRCADFVMTRETARRNALLGRRLS